MLEALVKVLVIVLKVQAPMFLFYEQCASNTNSSTLKGLKHKHKDFCTSLHYSDKQMINKVYTSYSAQSLLSNEHKFLKVPLAIDTCLA